MAGDKTGRADIRFHRHDLLHSLICAKEAGMESRYQLARPGKPGTETIKQAISVMLNLADNTRGNQRMRGLRG